jgi:glutamyl-Q tRNA(Asp) synthetase
LGSLLAAVGSFLDARHYGGRWLVRMEDLDTPRIVPGSAARILTTLERFGLQWDGEVLYQSNRLAEYRAAIDKLTTEGHTFECSCSRRELGERPGLGYPGTCRSGPTRRGLTSTRFRVEPNLVLFDDRIQGTCRFELADLGDFVIKRRDGVVSYQLAVVVDDAAQHVTDVVRGTDLLPSTAWQMALQRALALPAPRYAHLPLVVEKTREKLAKSRHSVPVDPSAAGPQLAAVLGLLNQGAPAELERGPAAQILDWAVKSWNPQAFRALHSVIPVT